MLKFKIGKLELPYCFDAYNEAGYNERKIEIPLGHYFIDEFIDVVEVGATMLYYGEENHKMIDISDDNPKVIKENALNCDYKGCNLLSLSTIEHFSQREYGNASNGDSIKFLSKALNECNNFLITFPCCYNEVLDNAIKASNVPMVIMERLNENNEWGQVQDIKNYEWPTFGHVDGRWPDGKFRNANAVVVLSNLTEILGIEI